MAYLYSFPVTNGPDLLVDWQEDNAAPGLVNESGLTINTRAGDDVLMGQGYRGLSNGFGSRINLDSGDDFIWAIGRNSFDRPTYPPPPNWGHGIRNAVNSIIDTGPGNDVIKAQSFAHAGIQNEYNSVLDLGSGHDYLEAKGGRHGLTVYSGSSVLLGSGDDQVYAFGNRYEGIEVNKVDGGPAVFDAGSGNDYIEAQGGDWGIRNWYDAAFKLGNGDDTVITRGRVEGLRNTENSIFELGNGDDYVYAEGMVGIFNTPDSLFTGGNGDDTVIARGRDVYHGFAGGGVIDLGRGNDICEGFGDQTIDGGLGEDIARFGFNLDSNVRVELGSTPRTLEITTPIAGGQTMTLMNIERFDFANVSKTFDQMAQI